MNTSLRDQLLQAGLVTEKQVRQAGREERPRRTGDKPAPTAGPSAATRAAQAAKLARDQELNRRQQEKAQRKARQAQLERLIEQERLPRIESDDFYSFIDGKKIRRLRVDAGRREQLICGDLAIVRYRGHYEVVPAAAVEKIRERGEHAIVPRGEAPPSVSHDDGYKDYVVPDDLMW